MGMEMGYENKNNHAHKCGYGNRLPNRQRLQQGVAN
jgi:hypothetical protein